MNRRRFKDFFPILIFFIVLTVFFISGRTVLEHWRISQTVLIAGNLLLFLITFISFALALKGIDHANPNVFFRSFYGGIMIKLFVCIIVAFIYISTNKGNLNKPALFTCMGLYLIYTFMEVSSLTKLLRNKVK